MTLKTCALAGCPNPVANSRNGRRVYCTREHAREAYNRYNRAAVAARTMAHTPSSAVATLADNADDNDQTDKHSLHGHNTADQNYHDQTGRWPDDSEGTA